MLKKLSNKGFFKHRSALIRKIPKIELILKKLSKSQNIELIQKLNETQKMGLLIEQLNFNKVRGLRGGS